MACKRADVNGLHFHDLRREAGTSCIDRTTLTHWGFAFPTNGTIGQAARVIVQFFENHPSEVHLPRGFSPTLL
jgi:hypothetical protein